MTTTSIHIGMINLQTNKERARELRMPFINLAPFFQRQYEAWTEKLKTRLIESILLNRAMNPIWTVENTAEECMDVLDGMHRLKTGLSYYDNEFSIGDSLSCLPDTYKGKFFNDLSEEDKNKIRNYKFTFNHLDSSYRDDRNKLMEMYEILNASSKPLNDHELHKPIYKPFYDILEVNHSRWFKTPLFTKDKITRGDLYKLLTNVLAFSEERLPSSFSSLNDVGTKWEDANLGDSANSVDTYVRIHGGTCRDRLERIKKYMDRFIQESLFPIEDHLITFMLVTRSVALIKNAAILSRHSDGLVKAFKEQIIDVNIQELLECPARNAVFQKKLVAKIDELIRAEIGEAEEPRLFTKQVIEETLKKQAGLCALCNTQITKQQKFEGDHIQPWGQMGRTIPENCQVVHQKCHKRK